MNIPTKVCRVCGGEFPYDQLKKDKRNYKDGVKPLCKGCHNAQSRQFRIDNPERARGYSRRYYASHKAAVLKRTGEYAKEHREQRRQWVRHCYAKNPGYAHRYRMNNPHIGRAIKIRRRARKQMLPDTFNALNWLVALEYFKNRCAVCGRPMGLWHTLAADHWIPLFNPDCPGTIPTNIVPLCHGHDGCNNSKGHSEPIAWLISRYGKRKATQILKRIEAYFTWLAEQGIDHD